MRRVLNVGFRALSIICMIVTMFLILFADVILKDDTVYTFITTTSESIDITFETDPLVLDGTNLNLMQGVKAVSESGADVTDLVDALVVNDGNEKVVMYSVNDSRYNLETFKRGLRLENYRGPSITVRSAGKNANYICDINEIEDYIYTLIVAGRITASDGYGNDISQNVYVDPNVDIREAGIHDITLMVKNAFADVVRKNITIKITGELIKEDEMIIATEMITLPMGNATVPDREPATIASEGSRFDIAINLIPPTPPTIIIDTTQDSLEPPVSEKPTSATKPPYRPKPTAPVEKPTVPVEKPTAPVEKPTSGTEKPTEAETAVIHFMDDNKREPLVVNVGDTFVYDVYIKLTEPRLQSFAVWTYFNQPLGTKKAPNQVGEVVIDEKNQVLKLTDDCYNAYYSPFRYKYDVMEADNHLIGFATGSIGEDDRYNMIETSNGVFTQQGGCLISTISFTVQKAGEVEVFTRIDDSIVDFDNSELKADYVAIYNQMVKEDVTSPTEPTEATEPTDVTEPTEATEPTEIPSEEATAIIHFADDNKRKPITVNVGDTVTYHIYLKLTQPKVHSFTTWTYFNQPVGTKKTPNQAGITNIPLENQVLRVERDGYTPYYSPFRNYYDIMRYSNYLIAFGMGDSESKHTMLKTDNGRFNQKSGCRISTVTFTVQKPGEVEVFTRLENAIVNFESEKAQPEYVAIYNEFQKSDKKAEEDKAKSDITTDLSIVKKQILGIEPSKKDSYLQAGADVNNDGKYTLTDIILINRAELEMKK